MTEKRKYIKFSKENGLKEWHQTIMRGNIKEKNFKSILYDQEI